MRYRELHLWLEKEADPGVPREQLRGDVEQFAERCPAPWQRLRHDDRVPEGVLQWVARNVRRDSA